MADDFEFRRRVSVSELRDASVENNLYDWDCQMNKQPSKKYITEEQREVLQQQSRK